jgi:hypothetical protein
VDEGRNPLLVELALAAAEVALARETHLIPGRVESIDPVRQTVNVQPWVKQRVERGDGSIVHERQPVAVSAPVQFPRSNGCGMTWPIKPGSTSYLQCPSISIDQWLLNGREVDAKDGRRHHVTDAVAIPTGHAFAGSAKPTTSWPQDAVVVWAADPYLLKLVHALASFAVSVNVELAALTAAHNDLKTKVYGHRHEYISGGGSPAITSDVIVSPSPGGISTTPDVAEPIGSPRVKVPYDGPAITP